MDYAACVSISFIFSKQSVVSTKMGLCCLCVKVIVKTSTGLDSHHRLRGVPQKQRKEIIFNTFKLQAYIQDIRRRCHLKKIQKYLYKKTGVVMSNEMQ